MILPTGTSESILAMLPRAFRQDFQGLGRNFNEHFGKILGKTSAKNFRQKLSANTFETLGKTSGGSLSENFGKKPLIEFSVYPLTKLSPNLSLMYAILPINHFPGRSLSRYVLGGYY